MATLELYLIRHGVAEERGPKWPDDTKRPLTEKGIAALKQEVKALANLDISFDLIISSPLTRTRQTADAFLPRLSGKTAIVFSPALTPEGTPDAVVQELASESRKGRVALVGHEPTLGELFAHLIGAASPIELKKGAICRIDFTGLAARGAGQLRWFLPPKFLKAAR